MASSLFTQGRAIGVIPTVSAARTIVSALSGEMEPCSQSISTQSNPSLPTISTSCGDRNITETPKAGSPERSFAFNAFFLIVDS